MPGYKRRILTLALSASLALLACACAHSPEPATPEESDTRTVLRMAVTYGASYEGFSRMPQAISAFNGSNSDYRVELVDYTQNGSLSAGQAVLRLNTEMGAGKCPDMIDFITIEPSDFIDHGLLLDLNAYIDADPALSRGDILIYNAMQDDGGLYYMSSSFMIDTLIALPEYFGDRYAWSLDEYLDMERDLPEGTIMRNSVDRLTLIEDMSAYYLDATVDWEAGTCSFDSEEYIAILDYCMSIKTPEAVSADNDVLINGMFLCSPNLLEGKTRLEQVWTLFPWTLASEDKFAGQALSWIGYPTFDGSCGSRVQLSNRVSICADSGNADGCWEFLKFLLTYESAENSMKWNGLPVYRPLFDEVVRLAAEDEKMTIADGERLADFAAQLTYIQPATHDIYGIVKEEAEKLLNGSRSSRETASAIQSRAALYVMERS